MMGIFLLVIVISLFIYVVLLFYCLLLSIVSFTVAAQFNPAQFFYTLATYVWSVATLWHYLGACWGCAFLGPTLDLLNL